MAALFGVTVKTVNAWIVGGMPVLVRGAQGRGKKTSVDLEKAVAWYFAENHERLELDRARTRLADEQSRKVAFENSLRTGDLGELSVWQRELERFLGELRAAFLAFPTKLAPHLDGDVNRRRDTLERAVHELLESCADYSLRPAVPRAHSGLSDGAATTAKTNGQPVGRSQTKAVQRKQRRARPVEN